MKEYRIKGSSEYFKNKYGTSNPIFRLEGNWKELTGTSWGESQGNPACLLFALRTSNMADGGHIPDDDEGVMYGKIGAFGELVHMSELEIPTTFDEELKKL